jgi:hypothetical protein
MNFEHYTMPMVHPTMGKTISSYEQLMNDPVTAKTWQMAFGKDFGSTTSLLSIDTGHHRTFLESLLNFPGS